MPRRGGRGPPPGAGRPARGRARDGAASAPAPAHLRARLADGDPPPSAAREPALRPPRLPRLPGAAEPGVRHRALPGDAGARPGARTTHGTGAPQNPRARGDDPRDALPPQLVGRDDEWAHLEEAWAAGRPIYVLGEAGIGKTRLVSEFCSAQGSWLLVAARPADPSTPYATSARVSRAVLGLEPERTLEPWVRQEIARLVPELEPSAPPLPSSPEEKARLAEALARLIRTRCGKMSALVLDNTHRADAASLELHLRVQDLLLEPGPEGETLRMLTCFRTGELSPAFEERLREHREAGLAAWLSLEPLTLASVGELIDTIGVPELKSIVPQMAKYTGCNPFFIIETARSLLAAGFDGRFPAAPPTSDRVTLIVEQRLKRLSPDALRLARTVALAGADFSLELATCVLGLNLDQLAAPWKELEEAKVLRGATFTQGVLRRIVIETLPQPVREAVLRRISACLQQRR
ncbi:AAA family ATPase [Archangium gephyra]|nr:AAA family ATPase [Archangium gephyra]